MTDEGSWQLPSGFAHPHASEEARHIAEEGLILRVQVGSGAHGTSISGQDDRDEMGIYLEPPGFITGIARVPSGSGFDGRTIPFEQYERHTAWDRAGGLGNRSGVGDLDVIIYSARKWARLALFGNPTVLLVLFAGDQDVVFRNEVGDELVENAHRFGSRRAADRFIGYLRAQRRAMSGESLEHTNRPELVGEHGYDTKFAMHAARLGFQGVKFLTSAHITLPIPEPQLTYLRAIRRGEVSLAEVTSSIDESEQQLLALRTHSSLPEEPDQGWVNGWLQRSYLARWDAAWNARTGRSVR